MNLETVPPGVPFLDALARRWLRESGPDPLACAEGLILLPTRRSARSLREAFLRAGRAKGGSLALLLPRIGALGGVDEAPLQLAGALDLPPAMPDTERLALLARLVMARSRAQSARRDPLVAADQAWLLAQELARLLDEAHRADVDLADRLPEAAAEGYAEHWGRTIDFLRIVTRAWPDILAERDLLDPAERGVRLLRAQAEAWRQDPPQHRVVIAGTNAGNLATAELMQVVANRLPRGLVVLPGLDLDMAEEDWALIGPSPAGEEPRRDGHPEHPQAGMRGLLNLLCATRGDVRPWCTDETPPVPPSRGATLWRALLPADALPGWTRDGPLDVEGLTRLEPADEQEEASAIALALREGLERSGTRVALVTPDRQLAARIAAELSRYGVVVDDSAGEPLGETPPGAFLRLLARAVAAGLAPVALLSLLKHPLTALGMRPGECRQAARTLERLCLRGPAPPLGLAGLRRAVEAAAPSEQARERVAALLNGLDRCLRPAVEIAEREDATPSTALESLLTAAEAAAATPEREGADRLWSGEEGEALAQHLAGLRGALHHLPVQPVATLPGLLDASMAGVVVRGRRALRGRDGAEHPRVLILGLLEARLQSFDLVVLGGLAEGVWPPAADPGPWMSRPMRIACGLPAPEEGVGAMAHDFAMLACSAPRVILSCPRRREGAPAVPARWLVRLDALLRSKDRALPRHPATSWARQLDQPTEGPQPAPPPSPKPPVQLRPRRLSVTEVETWQRDPYAIYARHILKLAALKPLEESADASDYGEIVHAALSRFVAAHRRGLTPPGAAAQLRALMDEALGRVAVRASLAAWWRPRLYRIADWVAEAERVRREQEPGLVAFPEIQGEWSVPCDGAPFLLRGRADRIELRADSTLAILDYKTGILPGVGEAEQGFATQLRLEAAMAAAGGFAAAGKRTVATLLFWRLTGGQPPGEAKLLFKGEAELTQDAAREATEGLCRLIARYDDPAQPYLAQPDPEARPRFSDYSLLARVAEWQQGPGREGSGRAP